MTDSAPRILRPPAVGRVAGILVALIGVGMGVLVLVAAVDSHLVGLGVFAAVIIVASGLVGARWNRAGVYLYEHKAIVRGYVYSRRFPRDRVVEVTDEGWIIWRPVAGLDCVVMMTMFQTYSTARGDSAGERLLDHAVATVREWSGEG